MAQVKQFLQNLFQIAVVHSLPANCMPKHLSTIDASNGLCVLGAGKAAVDMAKTMVQHFGDKCYGIVVTRHGYTQKQKIGNITIRVAGHPIPDEGSIAAGKEILALAEKTPADVPVVFLISGGGSALMALPIDGVTFAEKMQLNKFLLASGAAIDEINGVRKQLSKLKGGKLAQAVKGKYYTLVISDVVGDDPEIIASGPTVSNTTTSKQALTTLKKYNWKPIPSIEKYLRQHNPTTEQGADEHQVTLIANARQSIDCAISDVDSAIWHCEVLNYDEVGDANNVAQQHAKIALQRLGEGKASLLFSGGELTVTLTDNPGEGGPNQQYMLALAIALKGVKGISALACDTDGVDGSQDVAGAYIDETTLIRAAALGLSAPTHLQGNDCFHFFQPLNDLIITGPTHTNVNDFRVIMVQP